MSAKIRFSRHGTKKKPFYWLVVADTKAPRDGSYIEKLGIFNPLLPKDHPERIKLKNERLEHWIKVGARPTDRAEKIMNLAGIEVPGSKLKAHIEHRKVILAAKAAKETEKKTKEEATAATENNAATSAPEASTPVEDSQA
jgi:small subunit ribosomal protein S16